MSGPLPLECSPASPACLVFFLLLFPSRTQLTRSVNGSVGRSVGRVGMGLGEGGEGERLKLHQRLVGFEGQIAALSIERAFPCANQLKGRTPSDGRTDCLTGWHRGGVRPTVSADCGLSRNEGPRQATSR